MFAEPFRHKNNKQNFESESKTLDFFFFYIVHCNLVIYTCDLGCLPYCTQGRVNDFSVLVLFVSKSLILAFLYIFCVYIALYSIILFCVFLWIPFVYFYYEERDDDNVNKCSVRMHPSYSAHKCHSWMQ